MSSIFISYSRHSEVIVESLVEDIEALGHTVWFDKELEGGQTWWDQILANVLNCDVFMFVLDQRGLGSAACKREYGYAADLGKPILPVLVAEGVSTSLLPPALSQIQFVDYRKQDRNAALRLARAIATVPPPKPLPEPLPLPPEVPISYLGRLSEQIEAISTLTYEQQTALVVDLKRSLRDQELADDAHALLDRLRKRRDLLATIAEEIDELLGKVRKASEERGADLRTQEPDSSGTAPAELQIALLNTRPLVGHMKAVRTVCFSPDGSILASGSGGDFFSGDCSVRLWRVADGSPLRRLDGHREPVHSVLFSPDGATLFSASSITTWLWRVSDGARLPNLEKLMTRCMAISPDGSTLASVPFGEHGSVKLCRIPDGESVGTLATTEAEFWFDAMAFSPGGATLAALSMRTAWLWRISDGEILRTFKVSEQEAGARSVAFSPDGSTLALGASSLWLWRVSDGKLLHRLKVNPDTINRSVAFSADGAVVASGADDKTVRIWRVSDGKLVQVLEGHRKQVSSLAFSPIGTTLASGSYDQTVRLWDLSMTVK